MNLFFARMRAMNSKVVQMGEVYMVPAGELAGVADDALWLIYSPLTGQCLMCDRDAVQEVKTRLGAVVAGDAPTDEPLRALFAPEKKAALMGRQVDISRVRRLCVLANQRCNFACSYCYSARGRNKSELSYEQIMAAFDWFFKVEREPETPLTVAFIGGGEPLLSWHTISRCIEDMATRAAAQQVKLGYVVITNGSLITDAHIEFFKRYKVNVQVSFEVIPEIQDTQRGQYTRVHANLLRMQEQGLPFALRAVITSLNLPRMSEMVQLTLQHYPSVRHLRLEPVVDSGYLNSPAVAEAFYRQFYDGFTRAAEEAAAHGLSVTCTDYGSADMLRTHFCGPQAVLTPKGLISACEFESDEADGRFEHYLYGALNEGRIEVSAESFAALYPPPGSAMPRACTECWAKWNCGGGCRYRREQLGEEVFAQYCNFTRKLLLYTLVSRLRSFGKKMGLPDPFDLVVDENA